MEGNGETPGALREQRWTQRVNDNMHVTDEQSGRGLDTGQMARSGKFFATTSVHQHDPGLPLLVPVSCTSFGT